ncbi:DNA mismatch repair protein [Tilletiaria anomala UBC 951]|uniref:DNA mismatch repair protein MSH2 n=1 Tax=Tilletiaria anomala (strain ATCC 24038 / CBS 436.72 / UBC 951) TaxID=1037660 RepID=A0A066VBG3_TILAU|nr:DNA mismatch repair protein [Tilletiaria anomala UBC 951]KDN35895.1 DNA mismatch repair protein [Tilletiaria anomala UBC 951]
MSGSGLMYGGTNSGGAGAGDSKPQFEYDAAAESSFVSFFKSLPPQPNGTVRLFDRSTFYSAHAQDAFVVASSVYKTQSVIKYLGSGGKVNGLASCTLNLTAGKSFLREALTARQLRIEIWSNEGGGKRSNKWTIAQQASPGNLQEVEDLLFANTDLVASPVVIAFKTKLLDGVLHVGAAFADATNRELGVSEYAENDLFSNTESLLIQLGVKECVLPDDKNEKDVQLSKLRMVIDRCDCVVTSRKKGDFNAGEVEPDLERLLKASATAVATLPEYDLKIAMGAASALINYLGLLRDSSNFGRYKLRTHDLAQYLRLDNSAMRALSLFPEPGATGHSKSMSVFGLLNKCKTAQGTRMLSQWLKQPLRNLHVIQERQGLVELFLEETELRQFLQDSQMKMMPDLHRISKRFQRGVASLEDVVRVYQVILRLPDIISELEKTASAGTEDDEDEEMEQNEGNGRKTHRTLLRARFIQPLKEMRGLLSKLADMVVATIDLDELSRHNFVIKSEFDPKLRKLKSAIDQIRDNLDEQHSKAGKDLGLDITKKLHLENHSVYGYVFRVTRSEAKAIKGAKSYHEVTTQKNGIYFRTRELKELGDDYQESMRSYESHQSSVVKDIISTASSYCAPLEQLNIILAELDVLLSFAYVSGSAPIPYTKPLMVDSSSSFGNGQGSDGTSPTLKIEEGRHPCLEVQEDISFIPNDTVMEPQDSEFLIITGPNMGGKSTFIRQTGIIALMAQAGCFVPAAQGCTLPVFDCILARVGAGDSQLKGVSTFMAEMLETATILKTATKDSLIIIDELGRGTSTYDGFGLAWAISEWIATKIRCKCLFATHFHELTALAKQQAHAKNLHVVAHVKQRGGGDKQDRDITLLYKVEPGISDQSFGIHVAELANFPDSVIRLAKRKVAELEDFDDEDVGSNDAALTACSEDVEKGASLVEEFMQAWAKRSAELAQDGQQASEAEEPASKRQRVQSDLQVAELRKMVEEYRPRMEENVWVSKVMQTM